MGYAVPKRGLNSAYKVSATHFYRPCAGAQKGEPPPLSPPQRRGTMGQVKQILYSLQNRFLGKSQSLPPCGARKKSSRCSLARFFRPLRMLRLAASATGGARLRIPILRDPFPGPGLLGYPSYLLHRSVSSAVTSGRWAFRSHFCKSGAICARQPAAARPGRLYISRSAGFASSSASVSSRAV